MRPKLTPYRYALIAALVLLSACEDEKEATAPGEDVFGLWELVGEDVLLHIQPESITTYDENSESDCYDAVVYEVVDREGDVFTLDDDGTDITAIITREGDNGLVIDSEGELATYVWADMDPEDLDVCDQDV